MLFLYTATASPSYYTLSLHDALPIYPWHIHSRALGLRLRRRRAYQALHRPLPPHQRTREFLLYPRFCSRKTLVLEALATAVERGRRFAQTHQGGRRRAPSTTSLTRQNSPAARCRPA